MRIKALTSFVGKISMIPNEVREVADEIGRDLVRAGHAVEVKLEKKKETAPVEKPVENVKTTPARSTRKRKK